MRQYTQNVRLTRSVYPLVYAVRAALGPFLTKTKNTIRDLFVVNRDFFATIHDKKITNHHIIFLKLFPKKNKITIRDILSWLDTCLIKALRNPRRTNGIRRPV